MISFSFVYYCVIYYESRAAQFLILGSLSLYLIQNLLMFRRKLIFFSFCLFIAYASVYSYYKLNSSNNSSVMSYLQKLAPYNVESNKFVIPSLIRIDMSMGGNLDMSKNIFERKAANKDILKITYEKNTDVDRILHHLAAYSSIMKEGFLTKIFGFGWYRGARYEMSDEALVLRKIYLLPVDHLRNGKPLQPTALAAILVDTGLFGLFLVLINIFLSIISILQSKDATKYIISLIFTTMIGSLIIGNPTPLLLLWVLMMPNNPVLKMLNKKNKSS